MPSTCTILLVLYAMALTALLGPPIASRLALASPVPMPFPFMAADYSLNNLAADRFAQSGSHKSITPKTEHAIKHNDSMHSRPHRVTPSTVATGPTVNSSEYDRELNTRQLDYLDLLGGYCTGAHSAADNFHDLASNPPANDDDPGFQHNCVLQLSYFSRNISDFYGLAAEKGKANYDKNNDIETILKDIVDAIKSTLADCSDLIDQCPWLEALLGPIVYEIKCLLDELLDAIENLTDAIINDILPV